MIEKQSNINANRQQQSYNRNYPFLDKKNFLRRNYSDICCQLALQKITHPDQLPVPMFVKMLSLNASLPLDLNKENGDKSINRLQKKYTLTQKKAKKKLQQYQRMPSYIKQVDWKFDDKKGGAILHNKDKKSNISKLVGYICKRVLSSGSFMGISFPTFGMKPESILQTYCKCLGAAPLILQNIGKTPLQRIKAFNAIVLSISLQFNDIQKPFNPTIGETFQGQIGGYKVYAEQISHHPPISAFFLQGKDYILHGALQLSANLGMNSATGMFYGDVVLQFQDGNIIRGRIPSGLISGMMFGQTKFIPEGSSYSYDQKNKIICSYYVKDKDIFVGQIGKLLPSAEQKFFKLMKQKPKQIYEKFKHIPQKQFQIILSRMQAQWSKKISYDGNLYFDFRQMKNLPIKLTQNASQLDQKILKSESSNRNDIKLRKELNMDESQKYKEKLQDEERLFRKLRQKNK